MNLTASADQVVLVRSTLGGLAEALGFPERRVDDVRLAVTEACTNVVRHAYPQTSGRFDITAVAESGRLSVTVTDRGCGLRPRVGPDAGGLGLPLMAALTEHLKIEDTDGHGTTVRLSFSAAE